MLASLVLSLAAAFPPRGFVSQLSSQPVVLDRDTVKTEFTGTTGQCPGGGAGIARHDSRMKIDTLPGMSGNGIATGMFSVTHYSPGLFGGYRCYLQLVYTPTNFKFSARGTEAWAVWMDSAHDVPLEEPLVPGSYKRSSLGLRWRWSRIEGSRPWVRWTDTVRVGSDTALGDPIPLLTTLAEWPVDSVVPSEGDRIPARFRQNLTLWGHSGDVYVRMIEQDPNRPVLDSLAPPPPTRRRDTVLPAGVVARPESLTWSSKRGETAIQRTNSLKLLPAGYTVYVSAASTDSVGTRLWHIWSGGVVRDSFWIERPAPASLRAQPVPLRSPEGSWTIDGRRRNGTPGWTPRFGIGEAGAVGGAK